ncbi:MAG: cytidylyltransferase domain-containing protein [Dissulfurispiraceae bacterium]
MRILAIVQARCGSTRLPRKVLRPLAGKESLVRLIERVQRSSLITQTVVATTTIAQDDIIESLCRREGFDCFRGHPTDLLDRHYRAGLLFRADIVVKIPSDCPLIDPEIIDRVVAFYKLDSGAFDFVSNLHPPSYPDGNDVEVIPMHILRETWEKAERQFEREHTTPFIWDNPDQFRIGNVEWEAGLDYSMSHRWVLDYEEDYDFIRRVYKELYHENPAFGMDDILCLLERNPSIQKINGRHAGTNWYRLYANELKTIKIRTSGLTVAP